MTPQNTPRSFYYAPSPSNRHDGNSANVSYLLKRGVTHLCHFTKIANLQSILYYGILPINELYCNRIGFVRNDPERHDRNPNATSTSVSFPNSKLFYRFRKIGDAKDFNRWCVLEIDIRILNSVTYKCYEHNAARNDTPTCTISTMLGNNKGKYPEDVQAEIMIQGAIPPSYIKSIHVDYPNGPMAEVQQMIAELDLAIPVIKSHKYFTIRVDQE